MPSLGENQQVRRMKRLRSVWRVAVTETAPVKRVSHDAQVEINRLRSQESAAAAAGGMRFLARGSVEWQEEFARRFGRQPVYNHETMKWE